MTNDDIISAAFRVWGRELYKTTSLSKLAETLGVSKPALYRHFPDKQALLEAMEKRFYDDYASALGLTMAEIQENDTWQEKLLVLVRFISDYFARRLDYHIFTIIGLHNSKKEHFFDSGALKKRGVSFDALQFNTSAQFPSALFLAGITAFFGTGIFHRRRLGINDLETLKKQREKFMEESWFTEKPSEEQIDLFKKEIAERIRHGLAFDHSLVDTLPYEELEKTGITLGIPPDPLLKSIAEAVAEEGPWNASMETVAKRSGLSKGGLYAHFKSKEDMLSRLFMSEFNRIAQCTAERTVLGKNREEQLYLAILSIADYLLARPEILVAMSWVRIQQLDLDLSVPAALYDFFAGLKTNILSKVGRENISQWILLLLAVVLKHYLELDSKKKTEAFDYSILRRLFKFICLGVNGLE